MVVYLTCDWEIFGISKLKPINHPVSEKIKSYLGVWWYGGDFGGFLMLSIRAALVHRVWYPQVF